MNNQLEDIKEIRKMMEKSTKFLSLSGLSGVFMGIVATIGAILAYFFIFNRQFQIESIETIKNNKLIWLLIDAAIVLIMSLIIVIYFSRKKAKNNNNKLFNKITKLTIYNLSIPVIVGGVFCLYFLVNDNIGMVITCTLIFYGLGLVNASKYTFEEIHYLGLTEILLGIVSLILSNYGILIWILGFGICHIIYGLLMYKKYDQ